MMSVLPETDRNMLLTRMEIRYYQAIRNNEPFSVIKKYYAELKQVKNNYYLQQNNRVNCNNML